MGSVKPDQIANLTIETGIKKANMSLLSQLVLGFAAGAFIALGFLLSIKISSGMPVEWEGFRSFIGAAVFPIGLILCLVAGGELLTGNMMVIPMACYAGKVPYRKWAKNWIVITVSNFVGAVFVAYVFGHIAGMTEQDPFLNQMLTLVNAKIEEPFLIAFISGIGCNWLVALAVWMAYGSKDGMGMIFGIWFPTMAFVALGFQHVVANMFLIPAAIFAGHATWTEYVINFFPVFLGNAVGGSIFVACFYRVAYRQKVSKLEVEV